jgi:hypothetical protein
MNVEILNADGTPVLSRNRQPSRRSRRSAWTRGRAFVAPTLLAIAIPLSAGLVARIWASLIKAEADELPAAAVPLGRTESVAPSAGWTRIVYPYSIVPGGVHSAGDARDAVAADPVVASHYRDVVVDALHLETVTAPRAVYVSYRRGKDVYWTRRKLMLHPGETLLSDGTNQVRARCGNRVSDTWQSPVADADPPEQTLDQPAPIVVPEQDHWRLSAAEWEEPATFVAFKAAGEPYLADHLDTDPLPASPLLFPGFVSLAANGNVDGIDPGGDFSPVPEPGTLMLVGVGLAGAILRLRRRSHASTPAGPTPSRPEIESVCDRL